MAERVGPGGEQVASELPAFSPASNVLLLSPSIGGAGDEACHSLLGNAAYALGVTFTKTPAEWVDAWEERVASEPARGGIVAVGRAEGAVDDPAWAVKTVADPGDLPGTGIAFSEMLARLADDAADEAVRVCFDSVTVLMQYADLQRTFRFLHVLTSRVKGAGGVAHYHVDPAAHTDRELATLKSLFDAVVDVEADGYTVTR